MSIYRIAALCGAMAVLTLVARPLSAATLWDDDFDNGDLAAGATGSVNDGFQLVENAVNGPPTVGESGTNATITTGGADNNAGIITTRSFDPTVADSFTVTWDVSSQTSIGTGIGMTEHIIQAGPNNHVSPWFEFRIASGGNWSILANNGSTTTTLSPGDGLVGGVPTGYTVSLTASTTGWSVSATGFTANPNASGSWNADFDYSNFTSTMYVGSMIQNDDTADPPASLNVDSILVTQSNTPFRHGSFDDYDNANNGLLIRNTKTVSWVETTSTPDVSLRTENFGATAHSGDYFVVFTGQPDGGAGIAQTFDTVAGEEYKLTFYLARNTDTNTPTMDIDAFNGFIGQDGSGDGDLLDASIIIDWAEDTWVKQTLTFTALSDMTTLRFLEPLTGNSNAVGPLLDTISLVMIPTPAALPAGLMMLTLLATRQRR